MVFIKVLSRGLLIAALSVAVHASAQVSFVDGLTPLDGVVMPKANQLQAAKPEVVFKDCDECPEMVVIPEGNNAYYTVKRGDTLPAIGLKTNKSWRDIMRWNSIENPNLIEVGQVLKLPP